MPRLAFSHATIFAPILLIALFLGFLSSVSAQTLPSYLPADGLVGWWPFDGNSNDESGNGNHGVVHGGVVEATDRFGETESAFHFNGSDGYISIPTLDDQPYTPITYSAWVVVNSYFPSSFGHKFRAVVGRNTAFVTENGVIGFFANGGAYDNTFLMWRGGGNGGMVPSSVTIPLLNEWIHIAYTQSESGDWKWYMNGQLTNQGSFVDIQNDFNFFQIGGCNNNSEGSNFWNDRLDDVGVWNRALIDVEVMALYLGEPPVAGCMDATACNFNPEAILEDGSCVPSGCLDATACNFNPAAGCVGVTCDFTCCPGPGCCSEGMIWDVAAQICVVDPNLCAVAIEEAVEEALSGCVPMVPGGPISVGCPGDLSGDGFVGTGDLLELLSVYATMCPELPQDNPCAGLESINHQGHTYPVVSINGGCWFATNLRVRNYANGDSIPGGLPDAAWVATTSGAQAVYDDDSELLHDYGRLYNWFAVNDPRGLCPVGWHVPSNVEWMDFEVSLGMDSIGVYTTGWRGVDEGTQLKADSADWLPWNGTDIHSFSAVPGGYRSYMGGGPSFDEGNRGFYWTSSASIPGRAWSRSFSTVQPGISRDYSFHQLGFSVRCVRDQ
jgi:uncharacterized protein (TIGR02145 family)